jgi:hypothetical protein
MGGSDEPHNLVEVTIPQHAMFHYCNWLLWKNKEDEIAWKMLSGQIKPYEATIEAIKNSSRKTCIQRNLSNNPMWKKDSATKQAESLKKYWENNPQKRKTQGLLMKEINKGKQRTEQHKENYRNSKLGKKHPNSRRRCCCLGCKKETTTQAFSRIHTHKCFE